MGDSGKFRLGVLGSGKGSNLVAVAEACTRGEVAAEVAIVLSDVEGAGILLQAERLGVAHRFIAPGDYRTKLDQDAERAYTADSQGWCMAPPITREVLPAAQ